MEKRTEENCACQNELGSCTNVSAQYADISLPVRAKPYAILGCVETNCCGEPVVAVQQACGCGGCEVTITQTICIKIPIEYGATVEAGELAVNCKRLSRNGCTSCR